MNAAVTRRIFTILCFSFILAVSTTSASPIAPNPVPFLNPLVPTAVAPGAPGLTINATGTGFVSGSILYWNGAPRATTFVSGSKLTAAILAADVATPRTATITVVSPGPGGGVSNSQFFLVSYVTPQSYFTAKDVTAKINLTSQMNGGDLNNDGKLDLVGAVGSTVYVLRGNGDGTFQPGLGSAGPAGGTVTGINVVDVNGDGKLDLIVTGSKSTSVSFVATMLGNGDGTFQPAIATDLTGVRLQSAPPIMADFNGDGVLDLAFTTAVSVQTLLGNGDGTFRIGPCTALNQIGLNAVAVADFNKDGKLDLVVTVYDLFSTGLDFVEVLPGIGDGSFGPPASVTGSGTLYVGAITAAVGDFNGDGNLDIATGLQTAGATIQGFIQVSLGNPDGTFQAASYVPNVTNVTTPLLVGDFNGDGIPDLATGGFAFFGQGNGTFPTFQGSSGVATFAYAGDFNGDGKLDLANQSVFLSGTSSLTSVGLLLSIPPTPDFKGIVAPLNSILVPGGSVSITATLQPLYGFTGDVIVSASDLPPGITPSYNPVLVPGGSGSTTITLTAATTVPLGTYSVTISGNSGSITHSSTLPLLVNSSVGDWTSATLQAAHNLAPGQGATYVFQTAPINGFTGDVTPTVSGLPPGATATFTPPLIAGGKGGTYLDLHTSSSTPQPAIYTLTVTGTSGILTHSAQVYLGVNSAKGDFTGTIAPSQATTPAGGSVTYTLNATPFSGGAGDVSLTVSGLPSGASATFTPASIPGSSGSSTLKIITSTGTPPGSYGFTVLSEGIGVAHLEGATLVVTP